MLRLLGQKTSPRPSQFRNLATAANDNITFTKLLINGEYRAASDGSTFDVYHQVHERVTGRAANATAQDCLDAVEAAAAAQPAWEATDPVERANLLLRVADILEGSKDRITEVINSETAAGPAWVKATMFGAVESLKYAAALLPDLKSRSYPSALAPGGTVLERRTALGVVFSIVPWNAPIVLAQRGIAVPLLCGNTVVTRASEFSPASQKLVADAFVEAGCPPGVLNFITTSNQDAKARSNEIIAHPAVRSVNFTGSDVVGRAIAQECGKHLKPAIFELGGKSAVVVLADADVEKAAKTIFLGATANSGQVCMSTERVVVDKSVAPALEEAVIEHLRNMKEGLLPLFTEKAAENVAETIREAKEKGAELLYGDEMRNGSRINPHVFRNVPRDTTLWQRETFGPVISFARADNTEHAIEIANASDYSLTAAVFSQNPEKALEAATKLRAGCVIINGSTIHPEPSNAEFGLGGASGYGRYDVDTFTHCRAIVLTQPQTSP